MSGKNPSPEEKIWATTSDHPPLEPLLAKETFVPYKGVEKISQSSPQQEIPMEKAGNRRITTLQIEFSTDQRDSFLSSTDRGLSF
jgi:hypothetical protein